MVLSYFTNQDWSFAVLDQITGKLKDKWTWPTTSLIWLLNNGYEIQLIEEFSYQAFASRGKDYLMEKCGREVANAQEANSDLSREQKLAEQFINQGGKVDYRVPTWDDLKKLFNNNYLIICNINANSLYLYPGYSGHFVLPVAINPQEITIHDPGLPPAPSLTSNRATFEQAWGYPTEKEKNILAIRPKPPL